MFADCVDCGERVETVQRRNYEDVEYCNKHYLKRYRAATRFLKKKGLKKKRKKDSPYVDNSPAFPPPSESSSTAFLPLASYPPSALLLSFSTATLQSYTPNLELENLGGGDLNARLQAASEHVTETQSQLAQALQPNPELERLRKEHADMSARLEAANQRVEEVENEQNARLQVSIQHAKEVAEQNSRLQAALQRSKEVETQLAQHTKGIETLKAQLAEAKKPNHELEKLREEHALISARLQFATQRAEEVEAQLAAALQPNAEFEKLREERFEVKSRLEAALQHAKEVEIKQNSRLQDACEYVKCLETKLDKASQYVKEVETQLADAKKPDPELEKLRKEHFDLNARLQAASKRVTEIESQLAQARPPNPELGRYRDEQADSNSRLLVQEIVRIGNNNCDKKNVHGRDEKDLQNVEADEKAALHGINSGEGDGGKDSQKIEVGNESRKRPAASENTIPSKNSSLIFAGKQPRQLMDNPPEILNIILGSLDYYDAWEVSKIPNSSIQESCKTLFPGILTATWDTMEKCQQECKRFEQTESGLRKQIAQKQIEHSCVCNPQASEDDKGGSFTDRIIKYRSQLEQTCEILKEDLEDEPFTGTHKSADTDSDEDHGGVRIPAERCPKCQRWKSPIHSVA